MLPLGTAAPDFSLPDTQGKTVSLSDFQDAAALLVMFICNHCPFVKHVQETMVELVKEYQKRGVYAVAINANDVAKYPEDGPDKMVEVAQAHGYTFPYLLDETQEVAKAYRAACTPDFYVFDRDKKLIYRGRMDASRPGNSVPLTGADLRAALESALAGRKATSKQQPSMGCNIKWKPGQEPDYFNPPAATK